MSYLNEYFEDGLANPYMFTSDEDALCEACEAVGVFVNESAPMFARTTALNNAGRLVGGMARGGIRDKITDILRKCCDVPEGRSVSLTAEERQFIGDGIEKRLYKPFYK